MDNIAIQVLIVVGLIFLNGLFAMSEIAVVSSRKTRLSQQAEEGSKKARRALELASNPNRFLATVQVGITLVGIMAGAYGGATMAEELAIILSAYPRLAPYSEALAFVAVVGAITYLSLIIGELVPKRLALRSPERIAVVVARPMHLLSIVAAPLVHFLSGSTDLVLRLLRVEKVQEPPVTEEEISVLLAEGAQAGVFEEAEQDIVRRVFRFADETVAAVMTPRTEIVCLNVNDPPEVVIRTMAEQAHSRFVVCKDSLDNALGIVHVKDLLQQLLRNEPFDIRSVLRRAPFIPESLSALRVLERFKTSREHLAIVIDEYGGVAGLVTLDNILEAIVGDIPWVNESVEPDAVQREDGTWLMNGMMPISDFKHLLKIRTLPKEDEDTFHTLGGFVMTYLGRIPRASEHFTWNGFRFEVMDMDGNRVDKVLVEIMGAKDQPLEAGE